MMDDQNDYSDYLEIVPAEKRAWVKRALKELNPTPELMEDCRWAVAGAIAEIQLNESDRRKAALAQSKEGKKAARALAAAIRRLEVAAKDFEPLEPYWESMRVDPIPMDELRRSLAQLDRITDVRSPPPKPNADAKRHAVREARLLVNQYSSKQWTAKEIGELAAILFGDPRSDFSRYVTKPKKDTKPGPK